MKSPPQTVSQITAKVAQLGFGSRVDRFVGPSGYRAAVDALETSFRTQLAKEGE
jgi:hypothetical protein